MLKAAAQDAVTIVTHATSNSLIRSDTCPRRGKAFYRELIAFRGVGSLGRYEFDKDGLRTDYTVTLDGLTDKGLKKIGSWKRVKQNSIDLHRAMLQSGPNIPSNSYPLGKETVRAVTIIEPPFVDFVPGYENLTGNARFQGYSIDLLNEIAKLLNFKYELYLVEDGQFGIKTASGEWNGIVGELLKGNASLAGAPLTINVQREEVIDFSKPFKTIGISILIKRPQDNVSYFQFMLPLSVNVWMLIIIALAFVSVIMVVIDTIYPATDGSVRFNIKESLWFNYGALVQAGTENLPRTISGRMLASTWWFFSLIIISSYTANLAAFLTVSKFNTPISSVADLAAQTEVKYGTVWNSQVMSFFENSKIEHFKRMWAYMSTTNPQSMAMTSQEAFEKVANSSGDYAFLWDSPVVKYKTTQDCRMIEVGHAFDSKGYGIGVPPGAPYRDSLTMAILHLNEKGVLQRLDEKWWRDTKCADENNKSATTQHTALSLNMVAGVFFFLLGGTALSVAVGVMEWLMNRRRKRNDPKNEMKRMSSTTNHEEPVLLRDPFTAIKNHATLNDNKNMQSSRSNDPYSSVSKVNQRIQRNFERTQQLLETKRLEREHKLARQREMFITKYTCPFPNSDLCKCPIHNIPKRRTYSNRSVDELSSARKLAYKLPVVNGIKMADVDRKFESGQNRSSSSISSSERLKTLDLHESNSSLRDLNEGSQKPSTGTSTVVNILGPCRRRSSSMYVPHMFIMEEENEDFSDIKNEKMDIEIYNKTKPRRRRYSFDVTTRPFNSEI
ncbi:glutamate receptor ionotropic, kainate 3-like [Tubulanus polymorphus]|uniref:glutamate receptor ionotropic, kainate 3-like n=1 Tax=Tubulanus polymorphus TaxID=672921 RepID=UPI003DA4346B